MSKLFGEDRRTIAVMKKQFALGEKVLFPKEQASVAPYIIKEYIEQEYKSPVYPLKSVLVYTQTIGEEDKAERDAWKDFLGDMVCRIDYAKSDETNFRTLYDKEQDYEMLIIPDISKYNPEYVSEIIEDVRSNSKYGTTMRVAVIDTGRYSDK